MTLFDEFSPFILFKIYFITSISFSRILIIVMYLYIFYNYN